MSIVSGNLFETKIKYQKEEESGKLKNVTETYLVDSLSFTEAESKIIYEMTPFFSGNDFIVEGIKRTNYAEIFLDETGDKWYKAKVVFIIVDERTAKEKKNSVSMLIQASDFDTAKKTLLENMKGTMADYVIGAIVETNIMDVFLNEKSNG